MSRVHSLPPHRILRAAAFCLLCACWLPAVARASEDVIDWPMYRSPDVFIQPAPRKSTRVFPPSWLSLWLKALERPDVDLRCRAASAIAEVHRHGFTGLDKAVEPLIKTLDRPEQPLVVRLAAARALVTLDARKAAPSLLLHARKGNGELCAIIEPALARWNYQPARAVWLERFRDAATPRRLFLLAIQSLGTVREEQAVDGLRKLVFSSETSLPVRLAAARALGSIRDRGLEADAKRLAADNSMRGRVLRVAAATLLRRHKSPDAIRLLEHWMKDSEPAVVAPAVARLLEIDTKLVVPALADLLANRDSAVRSLAVECLFKQPTRKHIGLLANRLEDANPDVRAKARAALHELAAKKEWHAAILTEGMRVLAKQSWQGLEQVIILLTQLDHKPMARRLVELLPHDRLEVGVTAAWGLRKLAVAETLPAVARYVDSQRPHLVGERENFTLGYQVAQLNQFLGLARYKEADAILRRYIPRMTMGDSASVYEARASAIWALGLLHEGKVDGALASALEARLNDVKTLPPEDFRVRWMAAISLGRMKAKSTLASLRFFAEQKDPSCVWAVAQITGEQLPVEAPPGEMTHPGFNWFLAPYGLPSPPGKGR